MSIMVSQLEGLLEINHTECQFMVIGDDSLISLQTTHIYTPSLNCMVNQRSEQVLSTQDIYQETYSIAQELTAHPSLNIIVKGDDVYQ